MKHWEIRECMNGFLVTVAGGNRMIEGKQYVATSPKALGELIFELTEGLVEKETKNEVKREPLIAPADPKIW